jgi:hypothetical protein
MLERNFIKTSPYPLQRGTERTCPPLEGVGGGKNGFVISSNKAIQRQNKRYFHAIQVTLLQRGTMRTYPPLEGAGGGEKVCVIKKNQTTRKYYE